MPRGSKAKYTEKQKRMAEHIEEGYENKGVSEKTAESRAWATVNKDDGGGKKPGGSGRGKTTGKPAAKKGGRKGGAASASRTAAERSASAKKAAATRKRNAAAKPASRTSAAWAKAACSSRCGNGFPATMSAPSIGKPRRAAARSSRASTKRSAGNTSCWCSTPGVS